MAGGIGVASKIGKAAPILKQTLGGAIPTIAGFTVADIVVTDKNQNIANILIEGIPETEEYLARLAIDENDSDDSNANVCSDNDNDTCDDCSDGSYGLDSDGWDYDGDGACDAGDDDDDNDGS